MSLIQEEQGQYSYESPVPTIRYGPSLETSISDFVEANKENMDPNLYQDYFKHPELPKKLRKRSSFKKKANRDADTLLLQQRKQGVNRQPFAVLRL